MTITRTACVTVVCTGCGQLMTSPTDDGPDHFPSRHEALYAAVCEGWTLRGGADVTAPWCPDCDPTTGRIGGVTTGGVREASCVEVSCDHCRTPYGCDRGAAHFGDVVEAYGAIRRADWFAAGDRVICDPCVARMSCELLGEHAWSRWQEVVTFAFPARIRRCVACDAIEYHPQGWEDAA